MLTYNPLMLFNGIQVKFLQNEKQIQCFLGIFQGKLRPKEGEIDVILTIDGQRKTEKCRCLQGDQTVLLSNETAQLLLEAVKNNKECHIAMPGYYSKL